MNITQHIEKEQQIFALRESAQRQLAAIKSIDEGVEYLSKVKALEAYARATKQDAEIVLMVQEQKLRSMRILGKLLEETELNGGGGNGSNQYDKKEQPVTINDQLHRPRLADLGITKNESSAYQKIASIPEEVFEQEIEAAKEQESALKEITISQMLRIAQTGRPHISNNSGNNEWYTPAEYIELARAVLERIDLDPASCEYANQVVQAAHFFSIELDGLAHEWAGKVWMNPPYGAGCIEPFAEKLTQHVKAGDIEEAIVLVNNATETRWFQDMAQHAAAVCFPRGRIRYYTPEAEKNSPLQGQAFLYFGDRATCFLSHFSTIGLCLTPR